MRWWIVGEVGLKELAGIQGYSKCSYQIENYDYSSQVKIQVFFFIKKTDFPVFNTRTYVGESITKSVCMYHLFSVRTWFG